MLLKAYEKYCLSHCKVKFCCFSEICSVRRSFGRSCVRMCVVAFFLQIIADSTNFRIKRPNAINIGGHQRPEPNNQFLVTLSCLWRKTRGKRSMGKHVFRFYDVLPGSCFLVCSCFCSFLVDIRSSSSLVRLGCRHEGFIFLRSWFFANVFFTIFLSFQLCFLLHFL